MQIILSITTYFEKNKIPFHSTYNDNHKIPYLIIRLDTGEIYQYLGCHEAYEAHFLTKYIPTPTKLQYKQGYYALYGETISYDGTKLKSHQIPYIVNPCESNKYINE